MRYGAEYRANRDLICAAAIGTPCPGCGRVLTAGNVTADHIVPKARGGGDQLKDLAALCRPCNSRKGDRPGWVG